MSKIGPVLKKNEVKGPAHVPDDLAPKCNLDSRFDFTRSIKLKFNIISQIRDFL